MGYPGGIAENELLQRLTGDGGSVQASRDGKGRDDVVIGRSDVSLPADPDERESALEQRCIDAAYASPVWRRMMDAPVPLRSIDGPVDLHDRAVFDASGVVARGVLEIHDPLVARISRVDLSVGNSPESLVRADLPKMPAVERG